MIKAPKWCSHAIPTPRGWADPKTGELYVSKRFTSDEINEFSGVTETVIEEIPEPVTEQVMYEQSQPQMLHEAPVNKSLDSMTKVELLALAEQLGISVSKSATKQVLVEKLS
jgi:hypothetical protein